VRCQVYYYPSLTGSCTSNGGGEDNNAFAENAAAAAGGAANSLVNLTANTDIVAYSLANYSLYEGQITAQNGLEGYSSGGAAYSTGPYAVL
jgi:hypothetical protein